MRTLIDAKRDVVAEIPARSAGQLLLDTDDPNGCASPLRRGRQIKEVAQIVPRLPGRQQQR